jgi:hypothetical protein
VKGEGDLDGLGLRLPLVGRDREMARFERALERLVAGHGGVVLVSGDVGIGKSRLVAEVRRRAPTGDPRWLEGRALASAKTESYRPVIEVLRAAVGITVHDGAGEGLARLAGRVATLIPEDAAEILPYLATLLALPVGTELEDRVRYLDGQAMGRQLFRAARQLLAALARERPLVVVFEDAHWLDLSSAALVEHLLPLVATVPLLLACVSRLDARGPAARLRELAAREHADRCTEITLRPLPLVESARLLGQLVEAETLPPRLRAEILGRAEGSPLFLEEVVRALIDAGALRRHEATGRLRATGRVEEIAIPDTVQGVILARVDRLPDEVREVLALAAVVGRSFGHGVLRRLAGAGPALDRHLAALEDTGLIRERRRHPELEYVFRHVLVQEAVYGAIPLDRRRDLHRRVGDSIEAHGADRPDECAGVLAHHYALAEAWDKALAYLSRAGDQAGRLAADAESFAHYRAAMAAYARVFGDRWDPVERAALERRMGEAFFRGGDHPAAVGCMRRALGLLGHPLPASPWGVRRAILAEVARQGARRLAPRPWRRAAGARVDPAVEERARIYEIMPWIDYFADPARFVLDALLHLNFAERHGLAPGIVEGATAVGMIANNLRLFRLAGFYHRHAVSRAAGMRHPVAVGYAYLGLALHETYRGAWDAAPPHFRQSAAAFRAAGHLRGWGVATAAALNVAFRRGDWPPVLDAGRELVAVGRDGGDPNLVAWGLYWQGLVRYHAGAVEHAMADVEESLALLQGVPDHQSVATVGGMLGRFHLQQGAWERAQALFEDGRALVARHRLRGYQITNVVLGAAELALTQTERAGGAARAGALREARRACRAALRQGRLFRGALPHALCLAGTGAWLAGRPARARRRWVRSLAVAESLVARYDLGMTRLEMGRRLGDPDCLERAETVFAAIGAPVLEARARALRAGRSGMTPSARDGE